MVDQRRRQETNPQWISLQKVYDPGPESADETVPPPGSKRATVVPGAADPTTTLILRGLDTLDRLAARFGDPLVQAAKKPGVRGVLLVAAVFGALSGMVFGLGGAALFVWVHDQSTRGTVTARLDDQDEAINGLIDAVNGLLDEGEGDMECIHTQLEALQAGKTIPKCSTRGREKIRRTMPGKIGQ